MTLTKETAETSSSAADTGVSKTKGRTRPESAHLRADAVSLEIPIKVHGSLVPSVALGGQAPQPFEEQTTTMIVFPQGGVLKMSTAVSAGHVMVLTNLKSRQDAICRVVKVRAYAKAQSYVEVEFTSPQPGYWGVYFPTDGPEVARTSPPAESSVSPQPPTPPAQSVTPAPPVPVAPRVDQKVPDVSWAPAASTLPPAARPAEAATRAEALQAVVAPPKPPAAPKLPTSSFASIGTKEEVLAPADATRTRRVTSFSASAGKTHSEADSDISDAIDALIAPPARVVPAAPPNRTSVERNQSISAKETDVPAAAQAKSPVSHAHHSGAEASLPVPKQMFGVMLDSASPISTQSAGTSGGRMWIPIAIVALLAVGAAGAYYFHFQASGDAATPALTAGSTSSTEPVAQQGAPAAPQSGIDAPQQVPDQSADALQSSPDGPAANATADSNQDLTTSAPDPSAASREVEPAASRRLAVMQQAQKKPATLEQPQAKAAIPNAFAVRTARPVVRFRANANSVGAAPALDAGGSQADPTGPMPALSAAAPNVPAPPKPVSTAPIRVGGKILPPRLVSSVLPVYPPLAQQTGVTGTVVIDTTVDKDGNVSKMRVISGPQLLRSAALSALRQWKYDPSKLDGQPISIEMVVSIQFH